MIEEKLSKPNDHMKQKSFLTFGLYFTDGCVESITKSVLQYSYIQRCDVIGLLVVGGSVLARKGGDSDIKVLERLVVFSDKVLSFGNFKGVKVKISF